MRDLLFPHRGDDRSYITRAFLPLNAGREMKTDGTTSRGQWRNSSSWARVFQRREDIRAPDFTSRSTFVICISRRIKNLTGTDCFLLAGLCPCQYLVTRCEFCVLNSPLLVH